MDEEYQQAVYSSDFGKFHISCTILSTSCPNSATRYTILLMPSFDLNLGDFNEDLLELLTVIFAVLSHVFPKVNSSLQR